MGSNADHPRGVPGTWTGFWFGFGRAEITCFESGLSMWGWGAAENVARGAETPLFARAFVLSEGERAAPYVFVCLDLGMISESVRRHVLAKLRASGFDIDEHRLTLTATHTHSGPSGFSTYLFYAMAGPGFSRAVHDRIVSGTVDAILAAARRRAPGRIFAVADDIPVAEPVSFNRSIEAYNRNPDVAPVPADRADEALHRRMTVLRFEGIDGRARGLLSFFAVHATSVHSDNDLLHGDNKGIAARDCEAMARGGEDVAEDFVAIFAQEAAGDASPNYRPCARRRVLVGRYDDDFESAAHNGAIQARFALRLSRSAAAMGRELRGPLLARLRYTEFDHIQVDPDLAGGSEGRRTAGACLGLGFALGTREGPGPLAHARDLVQGLTRAWALRSARAGGEYAAAHGRKVPFWDFGAGDHNKIAGTFSATSRIFAVLPDRRLRFFAEATSFRGARILPWVPHHLPVQIVRIGDLAIGFLPFEPTTQSGRRLRALLVAELGSCGVHEALVGGYANAYASYLTTPEEYDLQAYEGATTMFGRWSLGATGTVLRRVAQSLLDERAEADLGERPPHVPLEDWIPHCATIARSASGSGARAGIGGDAQREPPHGRGAAGGHRDARS